MAAAIIDVKYPYIDGMVPRKLQKVGPCGHVLEDDVILAPFQGEESRILLCHGFSLAWYLDKLFKFIVKVNVVIHR